MPSLRHRPARRRPNSKVSRPRDGVLLRTSLIGLMVACGVAAAMPSNAQAPTRNEQPVLLSADQVTFDEQQGIVTATGNVELSQALRTVRADTISYNQRTKVVTASGNIRLVEPSGDIIFADYAELTDDLRDAFIDNIRVLMTDNGRMAGTEAERQGGRMTRVNRAVYSPCDLCPTDPTRPPLWQIRAVRVVHDNEAKEIRYKDATLEMFGVPVAYTPFLSHPDPTVDRKTGFLTPSFGSNSELGLFLRSHYYIDIAPDQDATVTVGGYTKQGVLVGGQYRKRFENGRFEIEGSITRGELPNGDFVGAPKERRWRGHAFAKGLFEIDEVWRWGFDLKRTSDHTYLRRYYDFRGEDYLTSRAFVEGFRGRNYAALNAYSFQDLRYRNTVEEPIVLPLAQYSALGDPGSLFGGRWSLDASVLALHRRHDGPSTRRFAIQPGWRRDLVSSAGFITTIDARVLATAHQAVHMERADRMGDSGSVSQARVFPQAQVTVRYPFVRYGESSSQLIEPIAAFTAAPRVSNSPRIPNEDSLDVEFDAANLFRANRFSGIDRLEGGMRFTYGLRTAIYGYTMGSASLFVGQSYRFNRDLSFPEGSGLRDRASDYVGRLELVPASWLDLNYGFRLDQETLKPRRHSLILSAGVPEFRVSTAYTYTAPTVDQYGIRQEEIEQATFGVNSQLSSNWSIGLAHVQAFNPDPGARATLAVLTYQDECFTFQTIARRDFTNTLGDVQDGNTIYFRLVFKNLGEFRTPGISASFLGGPSSTNP